MAKLVTAKEARFDLGMSNGAFWAKLNPNSPYFDPSFPQRIRIGKRAVRFDSDEILRWVDKNREVHSIARATDVPQAAAGAAL